MDTAILRVTAGAHKETWTAHKFLFPQDMKMEDLETKVGSYVKENLDQFDDVLELSYRCAEDSFLNNRDSDLATLASLMSKKPEAIKTDWSWEYKLKNGPAADLHEKDYLRFLKECLLQCSDVEAFKFLTAPQSCITLEHDTYVFECEIEVIESKKSKISTHVIY